MDAKYKSKIYFKKAFSFLMCISGNVATVESFPKEVINNSKIYLKKLNLGAKRKVLQGF
jgi:hypothetical protein